MNIVNGLEQISETIKNCVYAENKSDGLLEDVKTIISVYHNEQGVDEPAVWIVQHPTTVEEKANLSQKVILKSTFEFVCVEYDPDPLIAENKSQNLATRVGLSVLKNFHEIQYDLFNTHTIQSINFNTFLPVGEIEVTGKNKKTPVTGLVLDVVHYINWKNCCKKLNGD